MINSGKIKKICSYLGKSITEKPASNEKNQCKFMEKHHCQHEFWATISPTGYKEKHVNNKEPITKECSKST